MLRAEIGSEVAALARAGHDNSRRGHRPFLALSCPSLVTLPLGALLALEGGTLFVHEVGELAGPLQTALVNLLDKLSASGSMTRVMSATRHGLDGEIRSGRFRADLFFRLNVVEVRIPPLRERPEDVLPLARGLVASLSAELGRRAPVLSEEAAAILLSHSWPANFHELKNVIERALLIWPGDVIEPEAFPEIAAKDARSCPRAGDDITLRDLEREHISRIMGRLQSLKSAAVILGVDETTLWRRRKQYERERTEELGRGNGR